MPKSPIIVWFRRDLRVFDHDALAAVATCDAPVSPVFVLHEVSDPQRPGAAQRVWLHHSLLAHSQSLKDIGLSLSVMAGPAPLALVRHAQEVGAKEVFVQAGATPWELEEERQAEISLGAIGVALVRHGTPWLVHPSFVRAKTGGGSYKVFTPYWATTRSLWIPSAPNATPSSLLCGPASPAALKPSEWNLLPPLSQSWDATMIKNWTPGEKGAQKRAAHFFKNTIKGYADSRQRPDQQGSSRLSPHLAWGEISIHDLAWRIHKRQSTHPNEQADLAVFWAELGWREFGRYLWFNDPHFVERNWKTPSVPWQTMKPSAWLAWTQGKTGLPMVDAAMRELWATGWMHNRSRMVVADFWCKHLGYDWKNGATWFWDTLVDADPASNALGWQWASGTGPDAAPYYRVFNPVRQGERYDPQGVYRHKWLAELAGISGKKLDQPWTDQTIVPSIYPTPLITPDQGRQRVLNALAQKK